MTATRTALVRTTSRPTPPACTSSTTPKRRAGSLRPASTSTSTRRGTYEFVSSNSGSASDARRTIGNSLNLGGTVYDFVDIEMRKAFSDGSPTYLDTYWNGQGAVLRDGAAYGQIRLDVDAARVRFVLDTPSGPLELDSHHIT